jgi:hypothetical protein
MDWFPWLEDDMYGKAMVLFGAVCIKFPPRNGFQGTHTHRHWENLVAVVAPVLAGMPSRRLKLYLELCKNHS